MWFFMKVKLVCDNIKLSILLNMLAASLSSVLGKGSSKKPMPFITFHIKYRVANEATARCHKTFFLPQKFQYLHREKEKKVWSTVFAIFHYVRANQNESFHSHVEHSSWYLNIRLSRRISTHCFAQFFLHLLNKSQSFKVQDKHRTLVFLLQLYQSADHNITIILLVGSQERK